jgi:CRISPR-associated exonuclease Cas4
MAIKSHPSPGASPNISTESNYYTFLKGVIPEYEDTLHASGYGETARTIIADHSLNAWDITRVDTQTGLAFDEMSTEPRARLAQEARQCLEETLRDLASPDALGFDPDRTSGTGNVDVDAEGPAPEPIDFEGELQQALVDLEDAESHTEYDPPIIHASQIGYCERQAYLAKFGLKDNTDALGTFRVGTMIHEFIEEQLGPRLIHCKFEIPVKATVDGIQFVGRADCYDPVNAVVCDVKSRHGWYKFNPPIQRHLDQLLVYMYALDAQYGQVVYVSKKDLEVRTWPKDGYFEFDQERFDHLVEKAKTIRDSAEDGVPTDADDIPFEQCGCWVCDNEKLTI